MRSYRKKREPGHWWERFAVVVSAFALVVSMVATGISVWQTFLLQDQVNASDRNRSYEAIITKTEDLCELAMPHAPVPAKNAISAHHTHLVLVIEREAIDRKLFTSDFRRPLMKAYRDLNTALLTARIWATDPHARTFDEASDWLKALFGAFSVDYRTDEEFYRDEYIRQYALAARICEEYDTHNVRQHLTTWLATGVWPEEAETVGNTKGKGILSVVLSTEQIRHLKDDELVAKAIEQTEMLPVIQGEVPLELITQ